MTSDSDEAVATSRYGEGPRRLEKYPKLKDDPQRELSAMMELLETEDGLRYTFRDVGLRVEVDGDEFIPDSIGPTDGYVVLRPKGDSPGMIRASDDREVRIHVDMDAPLLALGKDTEVRGGGVGAE